MWSFHPFHVLPLWLCTGRSPPGLPRGCWGQLTQQMERLDECGTHVFVGISVCVVVISVLVGGLVDPTSRFEESALFRSINAETIDELRTVSLACMCLGLVHLISGVADVIIKGEWAARKLIFRLGFICAITMTRIPILVITADRTNPLGLAKLGVEGTNALCNAVAYVSQFEAVYLSLATMVFVTGRDSRFLRPSLVAPFAAAGGAAALVQQFLDSEQDPPPSLTRAFSALAFLSLGLPLLAGLSVVEKLARMPALHWAAHKVWPSHVPVASIDPGRDVDCIVAIICVLAFNFFSHGWLAAADDGRFKRARDLNVLFFIYFETIPACVFLILMLIMSANVTSRRVEQQRRERANMQVLNADRDRILAVLTSIVPPRIVDKLISGQEVRAERHEFAVIFFSDIENFTPFCARHSPDDVFEMLGRLFKVMDACVVFFPTLYKVETAGDSYMVVAGIDTHAQDGGNESDEYACLDEADREALAEMRCSNDDDDVAWRNAVCANTMLKFALLVKDVVRNVRMDDSRFVSIRIGLHCGRVVTGLSGEMTPHFCVFGDAVNTASRMETYGATSKVNISATLHSVLANSPFKNNFNFEQRELITVKGKGDMQCFFVEASSSIDAKLIALASRIPAVPAISLRRFEVFHATSGLTALSTASEELDERVHILSFASASVDELGGGASGLVLLDAMVESLALLSPSKGLLSPSRPAAEKAGDSGAVETWSAEDQESYEALLSPAFNVLSIGMRDSVKIGQTISLLARGIVGGDLEKNVDVSRSTFERFLARIGSEYRDNAYHNSWHAMCVVRETAVMLTRVVSAGHQSSLQGTAAASPKQGLFIMIISALVHDVDHRGTNNDFEVKSSSHLAILYNDNSVLENHHLAFTFGILRDVKYDVFGRWSREARARTRKMMTTSVLSTDMALHRSLQDGLLSRGAAGFDLSSPEDRTELAKNVLHSADIFNACRPFAVSSVISACLAQEFRQQVAKERELGLAVTQYMVLENDKAIRDGEIGFITYVARPYFAALAACFPDNDGMNFVPQLEANKAAWERHTEVLMEGSGI